MSVDYSKLSLEELFEEYKKVPDWDRFPLPEVFYEHFKVKKLQPATVDECASYFPPPHQSLGDGKPEVREPAPGGVREIKDLMALPVEVKRLNDETNELEDYPPPRQLTLQDIVNTQCTPEEVELNNMSIHPLLQEAIQKYVKDKEPQPEQMDPTLRSTLDSLTY